jgi:hypothetical protein
VRVITVQTVSPRSRESQRLTLVRGDLVQRRSEHVQRAAPARTRAEFDRHRVKRAPGQLRIDVIVAYGIAPRDQSPELLATLIVALARRVDSLPHVEAEPVEVLGDRVGLRVVFVERSVARETLQQQQLIGGAVRSGGDHICRLRVQRTREPLKACREQRDVRVIDLLSQKPTTGLRPAHRTMSVLDLIERTRRIVLPFLKGPGRHGRDVIGAVGRDSRGSELRKPIGN